MAIITSVHMIPTVFSILLPVTCFVTYFIAVGRKHVSPLFPYISDAGAFPPESCLFGQSMNFLGLLNFVFTWVRYAHVKSKCGSDLNFSLVLCLNNFAYWLGLSASLGCSLVGNFQETGILVLHGLGALMLFTPALIYVWIQAYITKRIDGVSAINWVAWFRLFLAIMGSLLMTVMAVVTPIAFFMYRGNDWRHWQPEDGGYALHLISTVSEWLLCLGYGIFVATFVGEFQEISIQGPEILVTTESATEVLDEQSSSRSSVEIQRPEEESNEDREQDLAHHQEEERTFEAELNRPVVVSTQPYRE